MFLWPWKSPSERRAERLLRANLGSEQRADLRKHGYFYVTGGCSRLCYRIGPHHAVWLLAPGVSAKPAGTFCVYPLGGLPAPDAMLAHSLWIQHDERGFCSIAVFRPYCPDLWYATIPILQRAGLLHGTNYTASCYRRGLFAVPASAERS